MRNVLINERGQVSLEKSTFTTKQDYDYYMNKVESVYVGDCGLDGLTFTEPSLCKPQFADECDLSQIVRRFLKTGELPAMRSTPEISDATNQPTDLFEALEPAVRIRQAFDQLPLEERNRFNNDPEAWAAEQLAPKPAQEPPTEPQDEPKAPQLTPQSEPSTEPPKA